MTGTKNEERPQQNKMYQSSIQAQDNKKINTVLAHTARPVSLVFNADKFSIRNNNLQCFLRAVKEKDSGLTE